MSLGTSTESTDITHTHIKKNRNAQMTQDTHPPWLEPCKIFVHWAFGRYDRFLQYSVALMLSAYGHIHALV